MGRCSGITGPVGNLSGEGDPLFSVFDLQQQGYGSRVISILVANDTAEDSRQIRATRALTEILVRQRMGPAVVEALTRPHVMRKTILCTAHLKTLGVRPRVFLRIYFSYVMGCTKEIAVRHRSLAFLQYAHWIAACI